MGKKSYAKEVRQQEVKKEAAKRFTKKDFFKLFEKLDPIYRFKFVGVAGNGKTGPMAATYTAGTIDNHEGEDDEAKACEAIHDPCPLRCLFCHHGCYAENYTVLHWWKDTAKNGKKASEMLEEIENTAHLPILRHNVAGDLSTPGSSTINADLVIFLTYLYKMLRLKAYTYTHCTIDNNSIEVIKKAIKNGFIINASTERPEQAKRAMENGIPAVMAVNDMEKEEEIIDGIKYKKCKFNCDKTQCCNCKWCLNAKRDFVVVFPVHGTKAKQVKKDGFLKDL